MFGSELYVKPLSEIKPDYNFLMGYRTGIPKEWYCGIEGVYFIWMGAWSDPYVGYKGYAIDETYLDCLWDEYNEEVKSPTEDGYPEWLRENSYRVFEVLDDMIGAYKNRIKEKVS